MEPQRRIVKKRREKEDRKNPRPWKNTDTACSISKYILEGHTLSKTVTDTKISFLYKYTSFKHFVTLYLVGIGKIHENGAQIKCWQRYQPLYIRQLYLFVALHSTLPTLWWCALPREKRLSAILGVKKKKNLQHQKRWIAFSFKKVWNFSEKFVTLQCSRKIKHMQYSGGIRFTTNVLRSA